MDLPTTSIAAATFVAPVKLKKVPEPLVILAAGALGVALRGTAP